MKKLVVVAAFALGGCAGFGAPSSVPMVKGDGQRGYEIRCGGMLMSMASCMTEARKLCGGDFTETNRSVSARGDSGTENRSLEVVCRT